VAYLTKAIFPLNLAVFYPYRTQSALVALAAAGLLLAVTVCVCRRPQTQPYLVVGWFWYLGTLVPVIGLVQVGAQAMADRYTYVPLIGTFIAAVWGLADLGRNRLISPRLIAALGAVAFAAFGLCTWVQVGYWHDSVSLWEHSLEITGPNHLACADMGVALRQRGQLNEALPWLELSAKLAPEFIVARENLGLVLFKLGQDARSKLEYEALLRMYSGGGQHGVSGGGLRVDPRHARAHRMLAMLLDAEGRTAAARTHLEQSLRLAPDEWQTHWVLGELLVREGETELGRRHLSEAARLNPAVGTAIAAGHSAFDRS
jgi:tetratricopeptide (TPR) repeat protein